MASERGVGLLVGLMFIIAFGLVLSELTDSAPGPPQARAAEVVRPNIWSPTAMPILPAGGDRPAEPVVASAHANGEDLVFVQMEGYVEPFLDNIVPSPPPAAKLTMRAEPVAKYYTVRPGDTLSKIASRQYGPDNERLYKLIYRANKAEIQDESVLYVGQKLLIPPLAQAESPSGRAGYRQMGLDELAQHFSTGQTQAPEQQLRRVYVVRRGDNLTRIARKVLNDASPAAVARIFQANRDKLSSPDSVPVGTELQIPS